METTVSSVRARSLHGPCQRRMARVLAQFALNIASAAALRSLPTARRSPFLRMGASELGGAEVAVLGGGFGGLYTALRLRSLDWGDNAPRVTLIDRNERFSFSPMLYELATSTATAWEVAPLYESLLEGTGIEFVRGEVAGLDEAERVVRLTASDTAPDAAERLLPYDRCVLALGASPTFAGVPGATEHAQPFYSANDALAVKRRIKELRTRRSKSDGSGPLQVCVVGGGYIGVELAANLASSLPSPELRLTLVHRSEQLLPEATSHSRAEAEKRLADCGIDVRLCTEVAAVGEESLELVAGAGTRGGVDGAAADSGYNLPANLTLWTAGSRPSAIVSQLGLPLDANGRVSVDTTLGVRGRPNLFALGDATGVTDAAGQPAPPTAQAAMQQADYAAWNVRASLVVDGPPALPFRYANLGEMLSLGEDAASVSALGQLVKLSGPLASASRRAVYAARMPTPQQAAKVGLSWAVDAAFGVARRVLVPPTEGGRGRKE